MTDKINRRITFKEDKDLRDSMAEAPSRLVSYLSKQKKQTPTKVKVRNKIDA